MSQTRVRLRALASLGLSMILFGAFVPATSASAVESAAPAAAHLTQSVGLSTVDPAATSEAAASEPVQDITIALAGSISPAAVRRRLFDEADASPVSSLPAAAPAAARTAPAAARPATAAASSRVIALAESHLGARYQHGATGPRTFDCSGLVYRVFEDAGLGKLIDGLHSASALYAHFRARHMTSTVNPQPGDLVIFGGGSHVGIYIGNGRVVHAMVTGVAITRISAVYPRFTTYVHLGLARLSLAPGTVRRTGRGPAAHVIETVRATVALSLRSGASSLTRRLAVLASGARLSVIQTSRDRHGLRWFEVVAPNGRVGWVAARYTR